ncbi:MAG: hypothetical protein ABIW76_16670 [Fibrobacteria bacterium]
MKPKFGEHLLSTALVAALLLGLMTLARNDAANKDAVPADIAPYVQWDFQDLNDPFEKALFADFLSAYRPGDAAGNQRTISRLESYRRDRVLSSLQGASYREPLGAAKLASLLWMYCKFLLVYALALALTHYGVQTLAVWRFVRDRRRAQPKVRETGRRIPERILALFQRLASMAAGLVLFSPAYVIAYSIRTEFDTDLPVFVVLLAVVSNGLLAMYSTKFHAFLTAESRKGYVETAVVKNLGNSYLANEKGGIAPSAIFRLRKRFDNHVFGHIFRNAEFQYLATLKEQAAYLITGLIIIEMALNIHGHLSYEMLKQLLYGNHDTVIAIVLLLFLTVKSTEVFTDALIFIRQRKYANATRINLDAIP